MWLNLGLLGLIAFTWILVVTFKRSAYHFKKFASTEINSAPKLRVLGMALLVSILVYGLFDTQFFKNDLSVLFWVIIAVIFVADHEDIPAEK
jgi:O-antigen ligase